MRKKKITQNYITQLTRIPVSKTRQHLISRDELTKKFSIFKEQYESLLKKGTRVNRTEEMIRIKLAYMMLINAYDKAPKEQDEEFAEKVEIVETAKKMEQEAEQMAELQERENKDSRRRNEYTTLGIKNLSSDEAVSREYARLLQDLESRIDSVINSGNFSERDVVTTLAKLELYEAAYDNLRDPEYKVRLDEILLLNFNPNIEDRYIPNNFAEITYIPEKRYVERSDGRYQQPSYITNNSKGDKIIIIQEGDLGFGRYRNRNGEVSYDSPYEMKEYKIIKKYSNPKLAEARKKRAEDPNSFVKWDDVADGEVFYVYGDINPRLLMEPETDRELLRYTTDVLLSTVNLEESIAHNGGYIGTVQVDEKTGEYIVHPQRSDYTLQDVREMDRLCLAKEFGRFKHKYGIGPNSQISYRPVRIRMDKARKPRRTTTEER